MFFVQGLGFKMFISGVLMSFGDVLRLTRGLFREVVFFRFIQVLLFLWTQEVKEVKPLALQKYMSYQVIKTMKDPGFG